MKPENLLSAFAVLLGAVAIAYTAYTAREDRNAALVSIGIAVLRADPAKEAQVTGARQWALDLIDANAGGVKFSTQARSELLQGRLKIIGGDYGESGDCCGPQTRQQSIPSRN
jgi:hypothetical protein